MNIAIIKLGALGDVVRTTSLLRPLHHRYSNSKIWWLTSAAALPLLKGNPLIHSVIPLTTGAPWQTTDSMDWVISLDEDRLAAEIASKMGAKKITGVYVGPQGNTTYTQDSRAWFDMSLLNRDADGGLATANKLKKENIRTYPEILMEMLNISRATKQDLLPIVALDPIETAAVARDYGKRIKPGSKIIGLNLGSGKRWENKQLTVEKALELINALSHLPATLFLLGGPEEKERNEEIARIAQGKIIDTGTDNSLTRFGAIIGLCDAIITTDSLAMHMATALKKRTIAFFGPTSATEIELGERGSKWFPAVACECFYTSRCMKNAFCLNTLDCAAIAKFIEKS
ncbi:MAG: hypothetical protein KCHDKBKB_01815 [Elusimicrobia bacterium]|nr:hypothetical protein [Elusimicrobiota bacterium]